jgi:hypothetical protein
MTIDATDVTKYDRTEYELEEFLLFCISVAGKTAKHISVALDRFLECKDEYPVVKKYSPFSKIIYLHGENRLLGAIQDSGLGQHTKLTKSFIEVAHSFIDLSMCTVEDLEDFHGIGPKTARYFILHSRPNQRIACLDTHLLKWLGDRGYDVPKSTPSGKRYAELEQVFLKEADEMGVDPAVLDLSIWNNYSKRSGSGDGLVNIKA